MSGRRWLMAGVGAMLAALILVVAYDAVNHRPPVDNVTITTIGPSRMLELCQIRLVPQDGTEIDAWQTLQVKGAVSHGVVPPGWYNIEPQCMSKAETDSMYRLHVYPDGHAEITDDLSTAGPQPAIGYDLVIP